MKPSFSKKKTNILDIINPGLSCQVGCSECSYWKKSTSAEFKKLTIFPGQRLIGAGRKMHRILFLFSGRLHISIGVNENYYLHQGYCIFLAKGGLASIVAEEQSEMYVLDFNNRLMFCNHDFLVSLASNKDSRNYKMVVLPIVAEITTFFDNMRPILNKERMQTPCYHMIKEHELCMIMWFSYGTERMGAFFRDILRADEDFRIFVQCSYKRAHSITELAYLANFSESTFKRRFRETFKETYHEWLVNQVSEDIKKNIKNGIHDANRLLDASGFRSYLSFYRFCKRYLKASPTELIESWSQKVDY